MNKFVVTISIILAIVLGGAVYIINSNKQKENIYNVKLYVDGKSASQIRVADIEIMLDKSKYQLVGIESGGFFSNSSIMRNDGWNKSRLLLMSSNVETDKPVIIAKIKGMDAPSGLGLTKESQVYMSNRGPMGFGSGSELKYRFLYE